MPSVSTQSPIEEQKPISLDTGYRLNKIDITEYASPGLVVSYEKVVIEVGKDRMSEAIQYIPNLQSDMAKFGVVFQAARMPCSEHSNIVHFIRELNVILVCDTPEETIDKLRDIKVISDGDCGKLRQELIQIFEAEIDAYNELGQIIVGIRKSRKKLFFALVLILFGIALETFLMQAIK
jgi:hypothetical protein